MIYEKTYILYLTEDDVPKHLISEDYKKIDFTRVPISLDKRGDAALIIYEDAAGKPNILLNRYGNTTNPVKDGTVGTLKSPGYHTISIPKGEMGQFSKIREEFLEMEDAWNQGVTLMTLIEMSDLYGAMEAFAEQHNMSMADIKKMSDVTKRAFKSGRR